SEPWTTALGLRALAMTGNGSSSNTSQAVNWLLDTRLDDGGWGYASGETSRVAIGDQNGNGVADLLVKFSRDAVQQAVPDGERVVLTLERMLSDGEPFLGSDTIRVIH
ncbi:MAG TPA: hypothetical protein VLH58_09185, partial [Candidatus Methylomirabilis sp.]|nr:hypothetical protein [Candidatus Methylomirabilis sp.]